MTAVAQYTITSLNDIVTSDTPPENPYFGMLWVNTATVPPETMVWDGQGWVVQNDLDALRGVVSTHTDRFSEFQSSVDGLNSYVGSLTETVETLEDSLGNEHTKVLEMQSAVSELEQTVHGLTVTVEEQFAGGINYVKNSAGLNGVTDDWVISGTVSVDASTDVQNNTTADSCFVLSDSSTLSQTISTCLAPCVLDNKYVASIRLSEGISTSTGVNGTFLHDGVEHTYRLTFDATTNAFEAFRDGMSIGKKTWPAATAPVNGQFGYVLGIHKGYSYSANFRSKAGFKIKSLRVSRT